jgi:hypothetical protein
MTLANMRANGVRAVTATSEGRSADVNVDALPETDGPKGRPAPTVQQLRREDDIDPARMAYGPTRRRGLCHSNDTRSTNGMACRGPVSQSLSREAAPLDQRGRASLFVNLAGHEMALLVEMIVDLSVN